MTKYIFFRLLSLVPLVFAVSVVSFSLAVIGENVNGSVAVQVCANDTSFESCVETTEKSLGIDKPLPQRFASWAINAAQGDLGTSSQTSSPVTDLLLEGFWPTFSIVGLSLLLGVPLGIALGIFSGRKPGDLRDTTVSVLSTSFLAVPSYVIGIFLSFFIATELGWVNPTRYSPSEDGYFEWFKSIVLPATSLALPTMAIIQRQLRSSMASALQSRYVLAARSRGVSRNALVAKHALPNAMIPTLAVIGIRVAASIGITLVVERIFSIDGLGKILSNAVTSNDIPVVQGAMLVIATLVLAVNLVIDVAYGFLNPKVRLENG